MSLFVVDKEKCKRDGICVAECPRRIIEIRDGNPVPTPVDGADELCINCGHCVAVCPHGAFSLGTMTLEQCPPVRKDWLLEPEQVEHFMRVRRSIRTYKDKSVEREVLTKLIDVARFAPSGSNAQPVRWLVIYDSDKVRQLAGLVIDWMRDIQKEQTWVNRIIATWESGIDIICRGAPHVIFAHAPKGGATNCIIAMTYLELAAPSFGLGTCWAGYVDAATSLWPPIQQFLGLPEGHISGAVMVGYPKYKYHRLPLRNEPKITWR